MTPLKVYVNAVTFAAPGIDDWSMLRAQLEGAPRDVPEGWKAQPDCLAPRAARRLSPQILLALTIAERIGSSLPSDAGWVFASSIGEGETLQVILEALRTPDMMVQPLRFQNAVHNAASGQWTIAAGLTGPATSIGAYAETVGAGVMKAAMQVALERHSVGLVFYDVPLPDPLDAMHPLGQSIGAGLALTPEPTEDTMAVIDVTSDTAPITPPETAAARVLIETLNPIAAVLPLLERLSGIGEGDVLLGLHGGSALRLSVRLS